MTDHANTLGFLLDVDNTLLDNDALKNEIARRLSTTLGLNGVSAFWTTYEEVRRLRDVVDLPLTIMRFAEKSGDASVAAQIRDAISTLPFADFVYPDTFATLAHLKSLGRVTILSDGDQGFQREKIEKSGLAAAVDGHVLIYAHKEEHLEEVAAFQPVARSVIVDDKARILAAVKEHLGEAVTTVHVLQGHYADDLVPGGFSADFTVASIGDLQTKTRDDFLGNVRA